MRKQFFDVEQSTDMVQSRKMRKVRFNIRQVYKLISAVTDIQPCIQLRC